MRWIAFAVALSLAGSVDAQTLYKCVSPDGTSYQQVACTAGAKTARTIDTTPEPPPTAAQLAERGRKAREDRLESQYLAHMAGTDHFDAGARLTGRNTRHSPGDSVRRRCESAGARRDRVLEKVGLNRNFDLLRKLDDEVAAACRRD